MYDNMLLIYILVAALVFLVMCMGAAILMYTVEMIRNNDKEETEDDPFDETEIAEGN